MEQINCNTDVKRWKQLCESERYKIKADYERRLAPLQLGNHIGKSKRTFERELKLGLMEQKRINPGNSKKAAEDLYIIELVYKAGVAQRKHKENSSRKGRGLKIENDKKLAEIIEDQIKVAQRSPDAIMGSIKEQSEVQDEYLHKNAV